MGDLILSYLHARRGTHIHTEDRRRSATCAQPRSAPAHSGTVTRFTERVLNGNVHSCFAPAHIPTALSFSSTSFFVLFFLKIR